MPEENNHNHSNVSLCCNLKLCLLPLSKLTETYSNIRPIADTLRRLIISVEYCCQQLYSSTENQSFKYIYQLILNHLTQSLTIDRTLLHIFFSRSPYWEHFERNIKEIITVL